MDDTIRYLRFDPNRNTTLTSQIVGCYQEVFAEEPWDEWKRCSVCGQKWGLGEKSAVQSLGFEHCDKPVVDYWPADQIQAELLADIERGASCWLALDGDQVIGFCWGYPLDLKQLEEKLKLDDAIVSLRGTFPDIQRVAYQDELGILKPYRGRKIAKQLVIFRLRAFLDQGLTVGVMKTKTKPPTVIYLWYTQKLGYQVIGEYHDSDGRVILARSLLDLALL